MDINSIKVLAELVDAPELIPFLGECGEYVLKEVEGLLHDLVAMEGHPSPTFRARFRVSILNDIWDRVYGFDQKSYLRWLILGQIEYWTRVRGLHDLGEELWILANLWDISRSKEDLDDECEALEDWDYPFLKENYLYPVPSPDAVVHTAGRAIYYAANGDMSGTVSTHETLEYFGWEI